MTTDGRYVWLRGGDLGSLRQNFALVRLDTQTGEVDEVVLGQNTLFNCDGFRHKTLTWAVEVTDSSGGLADCASWGHDPNASEVSDWGYDFSSCRTL